MVFAVVSTLSVFVIAENLPALVRWVDRVISVPPAWADEGATPAEQAPGAEKDAPCPACGAAEKVGVKPRT